MDGELVGWKNKVEALKFMMYHQKLTCDLSDCFLPTSCQSAEVNDVHENVWILYFRPNPTAMFENYKIYH